MDMFMQKYLIEVELMFPFSSDVSVINNGLLSYSNLQRMVDNYEGEEPNLDYCEGEEIDDDEEAPPPYPGHELRALSLSSEETSDETQLL